MQYEVYIYFLLEGMHTDYAVSLPRVSVKMASNDLLFYTWYFGTTKVADYYWWGIDI